MRPDEITVTVLYLGGSRVEAGCERERLTLARGSRIADVVAAVAAAHPALAPRLSHVRWARNQEFAEVGDAVGADDELALLPPVSGGAPRSHLTREPIDLAAVLADVASPEVGATVLFLGTVRRHARGREVASIDYEAYVPMAERQLERLASQAARESGAADVVIVHRHGRVAVGEASVAIAAAAEHREQAFAACRAAIELVKKDVPVWKRERTTEGEEWVGWGGG